MSRGRAIFGGRPVGPQVRKLMEAYPLTRGQRVTHAEISEVIGENVKSNRYMTVVASWRNRVLRETGIWLSAVLGQGYEALGVDEQLRASAAKMKTGQRAIARGAMFADRTSGEAVTSEVASIRDALVTTCMRLATTVREETKKIEFKLGKRPSLPRL